MASCIRDEALLYMIELFRLVCNSNILFTFLVSQLVT